MDNDHVLASVDNDHVLMPYRTASVDNDHILASVNSDACIDALLYSYIIINIICMVYRHYS